MGDTFQAVVDVDAAEHDASGLAAKAVDWLANQGVIESTPTDCVLGPPGYRPGGNYAIAVLTTDDRLIGRRVNGVEVTVGRAVYYPTEGEIGPAVCPLCGYGVVLEDVRTGRATPDWELFNGALTDWHSGGSGGLPCPNCGSLLTINEWLWPGEWPLAVGHLGFTFWNWPRLAPGLIAELAEQLGHRVVVTRGNL